MAAVRNKKKVRATTVPIRLSDEQKTALNIMSAKTDVLIADIVTQAVMQVFGKELNGIIQEKKFTY